MYGEQLPSVCVTGENKVDIVIIQSKLGSFWSMSEENCWSVVVDSFQCLVNINTMVSRSEK